MHSRLETNTVRKNPFGIAGHTPSVVTETLFLVLSFFRIESEHQNSSERSIWKRLESFLLNAMEIGEHCNLSTCGRLSFLPVSCPLCTTVFCESHFLPEQHICTKASSTSKVLSDDELLRRIASTGSSGRLPCQKQGCKKLSFEVRNQPAASSTPASTAATTTTTTFNRAFTHAAPRCERCKGLFCAIHRSATSHGCTAPPSLTEGQRKIIAMEERKKKAAAILARNFPNRKA